MASRREASYVYAMKERRLVGIPVLQKYSSLPPPPELEEEVQEVAMKHAVLQYLHAFFAHVQTVVE